MARQHGAVGPPGSGWAVRSSAGGPGDSGGGGGWLRRQGSGRCLTPDTGNPGAGTPGVGASLSATPLAVSPPAVWPPPARATPPDGMEGVAPQLGVGFDLD